MVAVCGALLRAEFLESRSSTPVCSRHPSCGSDRWRPL